VIGFLVFVFCLLQRVFEARKGVAVSRSTLRSMRASANP